ncbi:MAG: hypothetical protein U9Q69_05855, partial [Nanoarchaeota archaeon]|nr:hypothetical protein [Nanoarchaeota archaeon]
MKKNLKNLILLILTVSLLMCTTVAANYFEVFYEDPLDANKIKLAMGFDTSNYLYMPGLEVAQFHDAENAYLRAFLDTSFTGGLSLYLTNASEGLVSRWNRTDDSGFNLGFYPDVEEEIELELTDGGFIGASTGNLLIDGFQALTVMNPALHGASDTVFVEGTNADITFDSVEEDLSDAKGHGFTSVPVVRIQSTSNIELSNNKLTKTIYFAEIEETVEEEEEEE